MAGEPHRRFEAVIRVGADDWETCARLLVDAADHAARHGPGCDSTLGGCDGGHIIVIEDPEMTHNLYFEHVDRWLAEHRKQETT